MAISLKDLRSPEAGAPLTFTIVADGGMGKTMLGSYFPAPVFIRAEEGTTSLAGREDVALFPLAETTSDIYEAANVILSESHDFRTLVIDTVTRFNIMVEAEVLASDPKAKGLNQAHGGYGNAYDLVARYHGELRRVCAEIQQKRRMHIVFLAHATTETIDPPDGDQYTRYSIPMHKKALPFYTNDVDVVAYIKQKVYTFGDGDRKKASTDGSRIITCYPTPSHVSKNRLSITQDLPFVLGSNPFAQFLEA